MRDFSKVSTSVHDSERLRQLGDDHAAVRAYFYLLTCSSVNSAGCFVLKDGLACDDLFMDLEGYHRAMGRLCEVSLIAFDKVKKVVLIEKWLDHNPPTNKNHALGTIALIGKLPICDVVARRYREMSSVLRVKGLTREPSIRANMEHLSERFDRPIESPMQSHLPPETETRPRPDRDPDQTETHESSRTPTPVAAAKGRGDAAACGQSDPTLPPSSPNKLSRLLQTPLMKRVTA